MKKRYILIVDDDRDFAEGIAEILELSGHKTLVVHSGKAALEILAQHEFDMVFMDIRMPGINGVETFARARQLKPHIKVAMMTGYSDSELTEAALNNGAVDVLSKPVNIKDLVSTIEKAGLDDIILLLDDDKDFSRGLKGALQEHGYTVSIASNINEALDQVSDKVKLILLDLRLAKGSGLDFCRKLKKQGRVIPAIIVTAYSIEEKHQIDELKLLSINQVIRKPFHPKELISAIEAIAI
ncbi:MAG: response regulator [Proteobacteria bacterium]|nr:response regulator [Pseudomonadota bacterium]